MSENPTPDTNAMPEASDQKRRRPQNKLGDTQKEQLREVMRRPDVKNPDGTYNVKAISRLSGCSYGQVYNFVRSDSFLHAQLPEANVSNPPGDSQLIDAPEAAVRTLTRTQWDEYQAIIRQNRKMLTGDWVALGMDEEQAKRMEHYCGLGAAPTAGVLRLTSGQLISNLAVLDQVIKGDAERILLGKIPPEYGKEGEERDPEQVAREWRMTLFQGMRLQLDMFSHVHKVQAVMARVAADLKKIHEPEPGSEKRVFRPRGNEAAAASAA